MVFEHILRGLLGVLALLSIAWLLSANRKRIPWHLVWKGIALQIVLALLILKVPYVDGIFDFISRGFVKVSSFAGNGVDFLLGQFGSGVVDGSFMNFAFRILPTVIFFSALTSLLYYLGILQWVVFAFAWVMKYTFRISGAESLSAAGNIFLGQTEAPLLVRPYIEKMTRSEMLCLMTGGMATIAGGVMVAYIQFLAGTDPDPAVVYAKQVFFAKHLLTASIMSAPAAIVAAKMLVPETEDFNKELTVPKERVGSNALEAIASGTTDGLKLAVNVGAMLLVFTAFMYFLNYLLFKVGTINDLNMFIAANTQYSHLSFEMILGYVFSPIAWIIGIDSNDMMNVGQLLGEKTILNEFYAYTSLGEMKNAGVITNERTIVLVTYALCGFSNFASIGIQIGGIGALAPGKRAVLSELGIKALIGGTIACLLTAAIVGMVI